MTNHIPQHDDNRSAYVIAYMVFMIYGVLVGLGVGWLIWG